MLNLNVIPLSCFKRNGSVIVCSRIVVEIFAGCVEFSLDQGEFSVKSELECRKLQYFCMQLLYQSFISSLQVCGDGFGSTELDE